MEWLFLNCRVRALSWAEPVKSKLPSVNCYETTKHVCDLRIDCDPFDDGRMR